MEDVQPLSRGHILGDSASDDLITDYETLLSARARVCDSTAAPRELLSHHPPQQSGKRFSSILPCSLPHHREGC